MEHMGIRMGFHALERKSRHLCRLLLSFLFCHIALCPRKDPIQVLPRFSESDSVFRFCFVCVLGEISFCHIAEFQFLTAARTWHFTLVQNDLLRTMVFLQVGQTVSY